MKFLHTMGAIGLMGAMACLLVLLSFIPAPASLSEFTLMRAAMGAIATCIFLPSLGLTLIAGLLAIGLNRAYHNAGWAWVKLFSGLLVFEWALAAIHGPMQQEAELSARVGPRGRSRYARIIAGALNGVRSGSCWRSQRRTCSSEFGGRV